MAERVTELRRSVRSIGRQGGRYLVNLANHFTELRRIVRSIGRQGGHHLVHRVNHFNELRRIVRSFGRQGGHHLVHRVNHFNELLGIRRLAYRRLLRYDSGRNSSSLTERGLRLKTLVIGTDVGDARGRGRFVVGGLRHDGHVARCCFWSCCCC